MSHQSAVFMRQLLLVLAMLVVVGTVSGCALHAATSGRVAVSDARNGIDARFSERDRAIIEQYYAKRGPQKAPPGLVKRQSLPPGVGARDRLPPGLQARGLPGDLVAKLSPVPPGYVRLLVGADIVLMNRSTRVMADVIRGVAG